MTSENEDYDNWMAKMMYRGKYDGFGNSENDDHDEWMNGILCRPHTSASQEAPAAASTSRKITPYPNSIKKCTSTSN